MTEKLSILIVDDEHNLRETLAIIFRDEGHSVVSAANSKEALAHLRRQSFDVTFLDIRMPEISGLDLLPEIRKLHPRMPVLILTAHASMDSAIEAMRKGANDYLFKPIKPQEILQRVAEITNKRNNNSSEIVQEIKTLLTQLEGNNYSQKSPKTENKPEDEQRHLHCGKITIDLLARHIYSNGQLVNVTPTSFDYLLVLVRHASETVSYIDLVKEAQGYDLSQIEANDLVRGRIHELRKVLEDDSRNPKMIITVRGVGYRLAC